MWPTADGRSALVRFAVPRKRGLQVALFQTRISTCQHLNARHQLCIIACAATWQVVGNPLIERPDNPARSIHSVGSMPILSFTASRSLCCSQGIARSFEPKHVPEGTGSAPVRRR